MPPSLATPSAPAPVRTSLLSTLANILACPGEVFEELAVAPHRAWHWIVPTLLVAMTSVALAVAIAPQGQDIALVGQIPGVEKGTSARLPLFLAAMLTLVAFAATGWSALVLWFIGRVFLNARFSYGKAVEVVGLTGCIVALGALVTTLLVTASGNPDARPALSFLFGHPPAGSPVRAVLGGLDAFHLWATWVLAIGLSKLSGASFKESAFWAFGYWLVFKLTIAVLA